MQVVNDLHVAVNKELENAGITIPFPQRDLHVMPAGPDKDPGKDVEDTVFEAVDRPD